MGIISVKIQFHFEICIRNKYGKDRWVEQEAGLESGSIKK